MAPCKSSLLRFQLHYKTTSVMNQIKIKTERNLGIFKWQIQANQPGHRQPIQTDTQLTHRANCPTQCIANTSAHRDCFPSIIQRPLGICAPTTCPVTCKDLTPRSYVHTAEITQRKVASQISPSTATKPTVALATASTQQRPQPSDVCSSQVSRLRGWQLPRSLCHRRPDAKDAQPRHLNVRTQQQVRVD